MTKPTPNEVPMKCSCKITGRIVPIPGFPGYYARDDGEILSSRIGNNQKPTGRFRILKPKPDSAGYPSVCLSRNKKRIHKRVHRLMLEAFRRGTQGPQSRHLDSVKAHNHLDNLAWGSSLDNYKDTERIGRACFGSAHPTSKLTEKQVVEIKKAMATVGNRELGKKYGVHPATIGSIKYGHSWKHVKCQK